MRGCSRNSQPMAAAKPGMRRPIAIRVNRSVLARKSVRSTSHAAPAVFHPPWRMATTARMGPRLRGDDSRRGCRAGVTSLLGRQNLDQLALSGVDLGMLAVPGDGDFLEFDAELGVVVDHLAH